VEASLPLSAGTLYLLPSPLLGYGIPLIMQNLPPDSALLCIEADPALYDLSSKYIGCLEAVKDDRFRFVRTGDPAALAAFAGRVWGYRRFRRVSELRLTGGWQLHAGFYEAALDLLRRAVSTEWSNALTLARLGRRYMRNAIKNLHLLAERPGVESLDFGGCPVLVLGAGPSLDGLLDHLKRRLGRQGLPSGCRILCVDTALRPLVERNLKPDLVVALEAQHWNLRDFSGLSDRKIPVAMDLSALPATSGVLGGETYIFWTRWTDLSIFERLSALELLPLELPALGVETLPYDQAMRAIAEVSLSGGKPAVTAPPPPRARLLLSFIEREKGLLYELLGILKGESVAAAGRLDDLLDQASYLWAHFPDCAAGVSRPPADNIIFLKRVRAEIEPFIKVWDQASLD
jgi:hypothetical protein